MDMKKKQTNKKNKKNKNRKKEKKEKKATAIVIVFYNAIFQFFITQVEN